MNQKGFRTLEKNAAPGCCRLKRSTFGRTGKTKERPRSSPTSSLYQWLCVDKVHVRSCQRVPFIQRCAAGRSRRHLHKLMDPSRTR